MSFRAAKIAFEKRLNDAWSLSALKWPNTPFEPQVDSNGNVRPYVAYHRRENDGQLVTLNEDQPNSWRRYSGVVVLSIFIPENTSDALTATYTDAINAIFKGVEFCYTDPDTDEFSGIIRTRTPYGVEVGPAEGWWQYNVVISYIRDDH